MTGFPGGAANCDSHVIGTACTAEPLILDPYTAVATHGLGVTERTIAKQSGQGKQHDQHQRVPSNTLEAPYTALHGHVFLDRVMP